MILSNSTHINNSYQYARRLIEASLDPFVTISLAGKIMDVNIATEQITGINREQLIGSDFADYFTEPEQARIGYQQVFSQGAVTDYPLAIRHSSGSVTDVLYNASVYRDSKGNIQGVFAAARNITELKKAEEAANNSYQYARSLIEASLDPLVTISLEGKIMDVNIATEQITGINREELIGSDFADYFTEPEQARLGYQQVFSQGAVTDYPLAIRHISGSVTDVLYNASIYRDSKGNIQGVFAAARNITELKKAEEAANNSYQYARSLIEASLDPLVTISLEGKIMDVNIATEQITGINRQQLIGSDFANYFTKPEQARIGYRQVFKQGSVTDYPLAIRHISGKVTDVLYNASVYHDSKGNIQGVFAAARNITELKKAEEAANNSYQYARSLIEASLDPLVTISLTGKIMDVNAATEQITGINRKQLIGSDFAGYFTEPEQARIGYRQVFKQGTVTDYPLAIRHISGTVTDVLYNASVYRDSKGDIQGVVATAHDITEHKKQVSEVVYEKEEIFKQLLHAQKMESIGQLASGIAHDFNNILMPIIGFTRVSIAAIEKNDLSKATTCLTRVEKSANRATDLIDKMLIFAREKPATTESPLEISALHEEISEICDMLRVSISPLITLKVQNPVFDCFPSILIHSSELHQIITNLIVNARDAISEYWDTYQQKNTFRDTGEITIDILPRKFVESEAIFCAMCSKRLHGKYVTIKVSDTGIGIAPEKIANIFNPFFTTKAVGKGSGLGLSVVAGILHNINAHILVESVYGKGTSFSLLFPASYDIPTKLPAKITENEHVKYSPNELKICIVDDEKDICDLLSEELTELGYQVETFQDSYEALDFIHQHPQHFSVLITDYGMPNMSGLDLATNVLAIRPEIPILICTGYSAKLKSIDNLPKGNTFLFKKPVEVKLLAETIAKFF